MRQRTVQSFVAATDIYRSTAAAKSTTTCAVLRSSCLMPDAEGVICTTCVMRQGTCVRRSALLNLSLLPDMWVSGNILRQICEGV